jgi:hypothetical protein
MPTRCQYLTDNPFRLLGIGSAVSYKELRAQASSAKQAGQVGRGPVAGLRSLFGDDEATDCVTIVRSVAADPKKLTLYRLLWPSNYQPTGAECDTQRVFIQCTGGAQSNCQIIRGAGVRLRDSCRSAGADPHPATAAEVGFLDAWCEFLKAPSASTYWLALRCLKVLYDCFDYDQYLIDLLVQDGHPSETAEAAVYEAQEELIDLVLERAGSQAADLWAGGNMGAALELVRCVCKSAFHEDWIARALRPIVECGEREKRRVDDAVSSVRDWDATSWPNDAAAATALKKLGELVAAYAPAGELWKQAGARRVTQIATAMRGHAIDAANDRKDYAEAERVLRELLRLPIESHLAERVRADLSTLREIAGRQAEPVRAKGHEGVTEPFRVPESDLEGLSDSLVPLSPAATSGIFDYLSREEAGRRPAPRRGIPAHQLVLSVAALSTLGVLFLWDSIQHWTKGRTSVSLPVASAPPASGAASSVTRSSLSSGSSPARSEPKKVRPAPRAPVRKPHADPDTVGTLVSPSTRELRLAAPELRVEDSRLPVLRQQIASAKLHIADAKARLDSAEQELDLSEVQLDGLKAELKQLKSSIDDFKRRVSLGLDVVDAEYDRAIDDHNTKVQDYDDRLHVCRSLVAAYNAALADHHEAVREHNRLVDEYNGRLRR